MNSFTVAFNAVVPIFLMIILGYVSKKTGILSEGFVSQSTKFVFRISLPAMVFSKVAAIDLSVGFEVSQVYLLLFCGIGMFTAYLISTALAKVFIKDHFNDRGFVDGAFIQGAFRSNYMIVGYPVLLNLFGDDIVVNMALVTIVVIPLFNITSIIALTPPNQHNSLKKYTDILISVVKNPLILGIVAGFFAAAFQIKLPSVLSSFIVMTGDMATPLALVAIGAFFHFDHFVDTLTKSIFAVSLKLLVFPILASFIAYLLGFSPMNIVLIGVLFGGPTAVSSFAMTSEMGGDSVLAGNVIILSSLMCILSYMMLITAWVALLNIA
jgi:predicted permease